MLAQMQQQQQSSLITPFDYKLSRTPLYLFSSTHIPLYSLITTMPYPRHDFDIQVNWEPKKEGALVWVDKNSDFYKKTGIYMYAIQEAYYSYWYKYQISIHTDDPYAYTFYDEEGDSYDLTVNLPKFSAQTHDVNYNSNMPKIVRVVGKAI
jgi:hypothetical protein